MALKSKGDKCKLEVFGPDEDGTRIICNSTVDCPLEHPGEIGLDCFGAGNAVPEAGVQMPGPTASSGSQPVVSSGPPLPQSRTATGTPEDEPGAAISEGKTAGVEVGIVHQIPGRASEADSHVVVAPHKIYAEREVDGKPIPVELKFLKEDDEKWWIRDLHEEQAKKGGFISREEFERILADPDLGISQEQLQQAVDVLSREKVVQNYVDKLNEISMEMYLEQGRPVPPPIPILGPKESEQFLEKLENFKLTPEQQEFYRDARARFPPEKPRKLLKHRRRYAPRRTGGMIRLNNGDEEESQFEEIHGPVEVPSVKPQTELEKEVPKPQKPEETEEPEEPEEDEDVDEGPEQVIESFETSGDTSLGGYFLGLEVWTDDDGDHTVTLTIDAMSYDIMLPDFMEMLGALNKVKGRLQQILNT